MRGDEVVIYQQTHDENRQTRQAGRWHLDRTKRWSGGFAQNLCTVSLDSNTSLATIVLQTECPTEDSLPSSFLEVPTKWKQMSMWENLKWIGENSWIASSIQDGLSIAVTDGSYMKHLLPTIHSAALVLECQKGRGRLWCSFPKASTTACNYRGELVCLMAIHFLLLAVNETHPALRSYIF